MKPRVYISGRMSGIAGDNHALFNEAASAWRAQGWDVVNPAENFDGDTTRHIVEYVKIDVAQLRRCDAIAMLRGWDDRAARGSVWEHEIARELLGLVVYLAEVPVPAMRFASDRASWT